VEFVARDPTRGTPDLGVAKAAGNFKARLIDRLRVGRLRWRPAAWLPRSGGQRRTSSARW